MSLEALSEFITAAEHSPSLRTELKQCTNQKDLLSLCSKYGFSIKSSDLDPHGNSQKIEEWFKASKIPPIRKH